MPKNKPFPPPTLRLRGDAHRVEVIVPNGATRPVLGTRDPGDTDRRAATIAAAGGAGRSPRQAPPASIELALPRRTQTILSHHLPRAVQDRLNGGGGGESALPASRKADPAGTGAHPLDVPNLSGARDDNT
ncbi:hypothetical protein AB4851_25975 [Burkholderia sp. 22PA0099]|uniref:hypothetical protein n=1 Tax=Burkholderia sp. 22PA0099 TaxID=3237372 RepID=UPI0039C2A720